MLMAGSASVCLVVEKSVSAHSAFEFPLPLSSSLDMRKKFRRHAIFYVVSLHLEVADSRYNSFRFNIIE